MSLVTLVSGGLDSTLMAVLAREEGLTQYPLFVDYGQLCHDKEWAACRCAHAGQGLPPPQRMDLSGYGRLVSSGLTDDARDLYHDAFLPGRNLLFLLAGSAYAYEKGASRVAVGLLNEETHLFPDQTETFLKEAGATIGLAFGNPVRIVAPLMELSKSDVLGLAERYGITSTVSCHSASAQPCGECVSCRELLSASREE